MNLRNTAHQLAISIHTPREGGDDGELSNFSTFVNFNPHPPRGGRLVCTKGYYCFKRISIHTPREGGDSRNNRKNSGNFCDAYNTISFLHKSA